jgi:hypothetical protein
MIQITGSIKRAFIFPAVPKITLSYYSELSRIVQHLPHITLVHAYTPRQIRVLYETVELGSYSIRIYADLESQTDWDNGFLHVNPVEIETAVPVRPEVTMRQSTGHGYFAIDSQFFDLGEQTRIESVIKLHAQLQRPLGMKLMPKRVVNRIARGITDGRIREIADGFIKQSIDAFPEWLTHNA